MVRRRQRGSSAAVISRTQRRKQGYRLDKLVLKHAPMELRRWEIEVGLCRVTDVEDVPQRVTLIQP